MATDPAGADTAPSEDEEDEFILDDFDAKLDAFNAFRKSDAAASDAILSELGANDELDREILLQLAGKRPLGDEKRFPIAHARVMRALEVLDRNGARKIKVRGLGPLGPVAKYLIEVMTRFIVRSYLASVITNLRKLYTRREANALRDDPQRALLTRARIHAERSEKDYRRNPLAVPTFLLGGAVVSGLVSLLTAAFDAASDALWLRVLIGVAMIGITGGASWVVLRGSAIARRRIKLTTEQPLKSLYNTVGRCGNPPGDQSKLFALIAMILFAVTWILVPLAGLFVWLFG